MQSSNDKVILHTSAPNFLWFLTLSYAMFISISNWFDARLIQLFHLALSPGILVFPLTYLISDLITEVYGYKHARRAIWAAFLFNVIFLVYGQVLIHLPSPSFAVDNSAFDKILTANVWIIAGSFAAYFCSEPLNSYIVAKLKIKCQGKWMGLRFLTSTVFAAAIDSIIFISIAFGTTYSIGHLLELMLNIWLVKVVIELLGLPFSIRCAKILKQKEGLDIYDIKTNFSLWHLEANYEKQNNFYREKII